MEVETVRLIAQGLNVLDLFALIEAGYVQAIDRDAADMALLFATLTGERREIARALLRVLGEREGKAG